LQPAGYVCGVIGKWHLGLQSPSQFPLARGFASFYGFLAGDSEYFNAKIMQNHNSIVVSQYLTDAFTQQAVSFIQSNASKPFFLYLAYNAPHTPYEASQTYLQRVSSIKDPNRRTLAAMILALDDGVGRVMQTLQTENLLANTIVFFLSDNGAPDQPFVRNLPFRGYKFDTLEGGIHVPFGLQWQGTSLRAWCSILRSRRWIF
jgi:arylsulfatase A-like enzyme